MAGPSQFDQISMPIPIERWYWRLLAKSHDVFVSGFTSVNFTPRPSVSMCLLPPVLNIYY
jgi:hypothetical protein